MPYIRTPKGVKIPFSSARISEIISLCYREIYNKNSFQYRSEINKLTQDCVNLLEKDFGNDPDTEWHYFSMLDVIYAVLGNNKDQMDVYYAYLDFYEAEKGKKERPKKKEKKGFKSRPKFDPSWNAYIERIETDEEFSQRKLEFELSGGETKDLIKRKRRSQFNLKRSDWMIFWEKLSLEAYFPFDQDNFIKEASNIRDTFSKYTDQWFDFWKAFIFSKLTTDPRFYSLLSVMELRQLRYRLLGGNWMLFSDFKLEEAYDIEDKIDLDYFHERNIKGTYAILFNQFINTVLFADHMNPEMLHGFNMKELSEAINPDRDRFLDWRGFQYLKQSGSLLEIPIGTQWKLNNKTFTTKEITFELPQWAYMRLAIALASVEKEEIRTKKAIEFYELISTLNIIPTATMLREAGKSLPNYLEDQATIVADKYENIWESINETAIGTKWTGTVSLDWREVRANGSPINKGMRLSNGILPFLETINTALNAQERANDDKPVTNIIPIYHKDSLIFIDHEKYNLTRFNSVISVSDLFMNRAKNAEVWTMFDPKIYPEILLGTEDSYLTAESKIKERMRLHPKAHKQKRADKILQKLISHMRKGKINIVFENNNRAFNILQKELPQVNGVEGVGSFLVHKNEEKGIKLMSHWASWPSLAVNILFVVDNKGVPNLNKMRHVISNSLRMLDNAIMLSQKNDYGKQDEKSIFANRDINDFRHVCLGIIGLNETIEKLKDKQDLKTEDEVSVWMRALTSTWQTIILTEELNLVKERGVADIYQHLNKIDYFNPIESVNQLTKLRNGSFGLTFSDSEYKRWKALYDKLHKLGHRFISKSIYAPFTLPSAIAGVTTGGLGVMFPSEKVFDEKGESFWVPTSLLLRLIDKNPEYLTDYAKVMRYPTDPKKWHSDVLQYSHPSPEDWRKIMFKASAVRQWFDQGLCLTLPVGLDKNQLNNLIEQSWFYGISSIRFVSRNEDIILEDTEIPVLKE